MPGVEHRTATPLLSRIRDFARGRRVVENLRYADGIASRTQPAPTVPGGPYHKTSKVYYYARDARRLIQPPTVIYSKTDTATKEIDASQVKPPLVMPRSIDK